MVGAVIIAAVFFVAGGSPGPSAPTAPTTPAPESKDTTAPVISDVSIPAAGRTGALITWTTDEAATSQVVYGQEVNLDLKSAPDTGLVTSHSVILSDLTAETIYGFQVVSRDAAGNESISPLSSLATSAAGTLVGGVISENTTWTRADSPYFVTSSIKVPAKVTLTMEPGVSVSMVGSDAYMFQVAGRVNAAGIPGHKITLDGGMHSIFSCEDNAGTAVVDLDYCIFENGASLITSVGRFSLRYSDITNFTQPSDISSPAEPVYIEYNNFKNATGFITGGGSPVYIRFNYFDTKNRTVQDTPWVVNRAGPATMVNYNFFLHTVGIAVMLQPGAGTEGMIATNNYWGTSDIFEIDAMIWDKKDDSRIASEILYKPFRTSPEPYRLMIM